MGDYKTGTVATATVLGQKGVRVVIGDDGEWISPERLGGEYWHTPSEVTDIRPLIVLDLDLGAHVGVDTLVRNLRADRYNDLADQIEAQTKPPRIPEPGLWGVVEARVSKRGLTWHATKYPDGKWHVDDGGRFNWDDLIDPVLVREGIS